MQFSNPDIEDNEIQTHVFKGNIKDKIFLDNLRNILFDFYKDAFTEDEFNQYWIDSDFEGEVTFDGSWYDVYDNPFFTKTLDLIE